MELARAGTSISSRVNNARNHVHALARTRFYSGTTAALWRLALPYTGTELSQRQRDLRDAYDLHMKVLQKPGMREVLRHVEREDLATLPAFAALLPIDIARVLVKRTLGMRSLRIDPPDHFPYPDYYLHDFHNQANGNLSLRSALTYEWQIRFLFAGTNRLMRQGVVEQIPEGDRLDILDVACGPAAWVSLARLQNRNHSITGIDLSPEYLRVARLFRGRNAEYLQMNAEELRAAWTNRFDIVTSIWLFHELPPHAIENVTREMARVLKPGGRLLVMDSIQPEDDGSQIGREVSRHFHDFFAEPYFLDYRAMNLHALFARHGLVEEGREVWYRSMLMKLRKPGAVLAS